MTPFIIGVGEKVEELAKPIASNWSMADACKELQVTRYQLKQLLDVEIIFAIQKPDKFNRDWIIDKKQCHASVANLLKKSKGLSPDKVVSMAGIQRQGLSIVQLIYAMQTGEVKYGVCADKRYPYSLKQFIAFKWVCSDLT